MYINYLPRVNNTFIHNCATAHSAIATNVTFFYKAGNVNITDIGVEGSNIVNINRGFNTLSVEIGNLLNQHELSVLLKSPKEENNGLYWFVYNCNGQKYTT